MKNNTTKCSSFEELIAESVSGPLSESDNTRLSAHLDQCDSCSAVQASFASVVGVAKSSTRPDPGKEFWDGYLDRLEERMDPTPTPRVPSERLSLKARIGLVAIQYGLHPQTFRRYALATVLVGFGFLLGRGLFPNVTDTTVGPNVQSQYVIRAAASEERAFSYLDRSKTLLLGLINFDPQSDDAGLLNLPKRREIADELLGEATDLRRELSATDQHRLEQMIEDLELLLIQIANIEANYGVQGVEILRNGVDQTGMLLRINVEEMRRNANGSQPATRSESTQDISL